MNVVGKASQSNSNNKECGNESMSSGHFKKSECPRTGGSILGLLEEVFKVGQDPNSFSKHSVTVSDYFVIIRGTYRTSRQNFLMIAVYASQDSRDKQTLWDFLHHEISKWKWEVIIMGDFNEVRFISDKFGSIFNEHGAHLFNSFILDSGLVEVPLGGCHFTWCLKSAKKMSKLDRFLVSENLLASCPHLTAITLERYLSDHRPILLQENHYDYGPTPFDGNGSKAKIKWAIEGDENSKFFHRALNKKRNSLNMRGVMVDGVWVDDPKSVKREFLDHFSKRFCNPDYGRATLLMDFPNRLHPDQACDLEAVVTNEEIKRAVWECGTDKAHVRMVSLLVSCVIFGISWIRICLMRIRRDMSESPRHKPGEKGRRGGGVFNRVGDKGKSVSAHSKSRYQSYSFEKTESIPKKCHHERTYSRRTEMISESEDSGGGHWKSKLKKQRSSIEDDLPKKTRMPNNVKTYDGSDDPKDHLKIFQAAAKVEHWAMPTWCHMFNSTLTGSARVWFDDLPPESVDSYDDLKKAFLANHLQQKKCIKDPIEIHHIKQRERESTKDFVQRFKTESRHVKGDSKFMRISGFMHRITNP
nr:reverse transcriptase domain-containing protein [Tanacetum cinerariifolium]